MLPFVLALRSSLAPCTHFPAGNTYSFVTSLAQVEPEYSLFFGVTSSSLHAVCGPTYGINPPVPGYHGCHPHGPVCISSTITCLYFPEEHLSFASRISPEPPPRKRDTVYEYVLRTTPFQQQPPCDPSSPLNSGPFPTTTTTGCITALASIPGLLSSRKTPAFSPQVSRK